MTHGRKPRKPRPVALNPLGLAKDRAGALTREELASTMAPIRQCEARLREGVATEDQFAVLRTSLLVAQEIEASGIVRGLHEHLASAMKAMDTIHDRAMATGTWRPTSLYYFELDAIRHAVDLHAFQLRKVSQGELTNLAQRVCARASSAGGVARRASFHELGLVPA